MLTTALVTSASSTPDIAPTQAQHRPPVVKVPKVETLDQLHRALSVIESAENADTLLPLRELRISDAGLITIPGNGDYILTDWARRQLAQTLGVKWDRWFALLSDGERAEEINKRLDRSPGEVRLRTADWRDPDSDVAVPVLRAFVSSRYTPYSDAALAGLLAEVVGTKKHAVSRISVTDMTVSYALYLDHPVRPGADAKVGDLQGGIFVRNSGVGYASLAVTAHLMRLICLNGMMMPIEEPTLVSAVHRNASVDKVRQRLADRAKVIGGAFAEGANRLLASRHRDVTDREAAFLEILKDAHLAKRHVPALEAAYNREPEPTAFGIVQAVTLAAQSFAPEPRYELERAAANYLTGYAPA